MRDTIGKTESAGNPKSEDVLVPPAALAADFAALHGALVAAAGATAFAPAFAASGLLTAATLSTLVRAATAAGAVTILFSFVAGHKHSLLKTVLFVSPPAKWGGLPGENRQSEISHETTMLVVVDVVGSDRVCGG